MTQDILTEVDGGVAVVTFNRPSRYNALTREMLSNLGTILTAYAEDPEIGCVVVTGAGKAFCSGGDVQVQAQMAAGGATQTPEERADILRRTMRASELLHDMPKPTIAMVNGVAAGAGMSLALACDLRVVAESGRMTTAFAKVGLSGDYGGTYFLTQLVGPAMARELYLLSEVMDAPRLRALGLASRVVPDAALREETLALARQFANGPRVAYRYIKRNLNIAEKGVLSDTLDAEALGLMRTRMTEDHAEAARAFVEKRAPVFRGR
jgi:2-(1,2-epoxy-1,2-dihydrophenyl)acetyl-CoA isomerase